MDRQPSRSRQYDNSSHPDHAGTGSGNRFSVSLPKVTTTLCVIPAAGFISCVLLSLLNDFESSTATHCKVRNYLPSISAAIGLTPQRYIWRISIALLSTPRYLSLAFNYHYFSRNFVVKQQNLYQAVVKCSAFILFMELSALIGLSFVSSTEDYSFHEGCFIVFISCSLFHMSLNLIVGRWAHRWQPLIGKHRQSYIRKRNTFIFNASVFGLSVYLFFRHNAYCEPGVYSLFALCEYLIVLSNIYYHNIDYLYLFNEREFGIIIPDVHHSS